MKRNTVYAGLFAVMFALASCLSIEVGRYGHDPAEELDWDKISSNAANASKQARQESGLAKTPIVEADTIVSAEVRTAFREVSAARYHLLERSSKPFFSSDVFYDLRHRQRNVEPKIEILASDAPVAITYADNTILFSRRFADNLVGDTLASNHWALRTVAAHELAHYQDSHAIYNWLARGGQNRVKQQQAASGLSSITSILPVSFKYENQPGYMYQNIEHHPILFEFLADYWSYYTLQELEAPKGVVSETLFAIRDATYSEGIKDQSLNLSNLIDRRAKCMMFLDGEAKIEDSVGAANLGGWGLALYMMTTPDGFRRMYPEFFADEASGPTEEADTASSEEIEDSAVASDTREAEPLLSDGAYWFCAMAALGEANSRNPKLTALFASDDPAVMSAAFMKHADYEDVESSVALIMTDELDGIPLLEPVRAYNSPKPDIRPNLYIDDLKFVGIEDSGVFKFEFVFGNSGRSSALADSQLTMTVDGEPIPISVTLKNKHRQTDEVNNVVGMTSCDTQEFLDEGSACGKATLSRGIRESGRFEAELFAYLPNALSGQLIEGKFLFDACAPEDTDTLACQNPELNVEDNQEEIVFGILPDLIGISRSSFNADHSLTITNVGYQAVNTPFEIGLRYRRSDVVLTQCSEDEFASENSNCLRVIVTEPIPAGKSVSIDFRSVDASTGEDSIVSSFYIDSCKERDESDSPTCAILEIDETNNDYG